MTDVAGDARTGPVDWWRVLFVALACVPPAIFIAHMADTPAVWRPGLLSDDAHYYLGVARSIAEGEGSTFTGLVETNGYHPLWLLCLVPLAAVFEQPDHLVLAVAALHGVLWALSVREAMRIGRAVGCWSCAAAGIAAYSVLAASTGQLAFNGMESGLAMLLLLVVVRMLVEDEHPDLVIGAVIAGLCMARLDAVTVAVPLGLVALGRGARGDLVRRAALLAGPSAISLGLYVAVNQLVFGSPTPVSGRAKSLGAPFLNAEPARQFIRAGDVIGRPLWFGAASLLLVALAVATRPWRDGNRPARLASCMAAVVVGQVLLLSYLVIGTSYRVWPWYHYLVAVYAFIATVLVARWAIVHVGAVAQRVAVAAAVGALVVHGVVIFRPQDPGYPGSVAGAEFVRANLPSDAVLAMGDRAGLFGVLSDRPLLQLEGLVADTAYLHALDDGVAPERLADAGVDYYIRYGPPGQRVEVGGDTCERITEPFQGRGPSFAVVVCDDDLLFATGERGDQFRLWAYRPEINEG